jgi:hypothetical protein
MNSKAMVRKRYVRPVANRPQAFPLTMQKQAYRDKRDVKLLLTGIAIGILVTLLVSSSGLL